MAILVFGGGFTLLMLAVVLLIDQSFFYPRLQTDALLYYLKGKSLADSGTTAARLAVNLPPFPYASMPGALRAPLIAMFRDFDDQLRAIQVLNIAITDGLALMSAYIFSWVLPRSRHWMAIGFAFGFMLLAPWWVANIFLALADGPYALFSLGSVIIAIRVLTSPRDMSRPLPLLGFAAAFVMAFLLRFTEPIVLVLAAVLLSGRMNGRRIQRQTLFTALAVIVIAMGLLVFVNRDAIFNRYLAEPFYLFVRGDKESIFLNFVALAVPEQVIPGFALVFSHSPIVDLYHAEFASSRIDAFWSSIGFVITGIVALGAWRVRHWMLPEILMVLCVLPVLVVMMPSTSRYFMTYQPLFWIAFYEGGRALTSRIPTIVRRTIVAYSGILALLALAVGLAAGLRARGAQGAAPGGSRLATLTDLPRYVQGVSGTYRPLRDFLRTLPPSRTVLTSSSPSLGRWKAIANLDYYAADSGLTALAARKDVYLVIDCGSADLCAHEAEHEARVKSQLCAVGEFDYEVVFEAKAEKSAAKVFRIRPAP